MSRIGAPMVGGVITAPLLSMFLSAAASLSPMAQPRACHATVVIGTDPKFDTRRCDTKPSYCQFRP
jgi:hypothetical protein